MGNKFKPSFTLWTKLLPPVVASPEVIGVSPTPVSPNGVPVTPPKLCYRICHVVSPSTRHLTGWQCLAYPCGSWRFIYRCMSKPTLFLEDIGCISKVTWRYSCCYHHFLIWLRYWFWLLYWRWSRLYYWSTLGSVSYWCLYMKPCLGLSLTRYRRCLFVKVPFCR